MLTLGIFGKTIAGSATCTERSETGPVEREKVFVDVWCGGGGGIFALGKGGGERADVGKKNWGKSPALSAGEYRTVNGTSTSDLVMEQVVLLLGVTSKRERGTGPSEFP